MWNTNISGTESRNEKLSIDLSNYDAGIYFVQVVTDDVVYNAKVVKEEKLNH